MSTLPRYTTTCRTLYTSQILHQIDNDGVKHGEAGEAPVVTRFLQLAGGLGSGLCGVELLLRRQPEQVAALPLLRRR